MNSLQPIRLSELKTQATFLLKDLRQHPGHSPASISRFLRHPHLSGKTVDWLVNHADAVQLKHAYLVIALENGFQSWAHLKKAVTTNDCFYRSSCILYIHAWFNSYEKAVIYHREHGGYLIGFWKDVVVCGHEYINCIGLGDHKDLWERTGYDIIRPANPEAASQLYKIAADNYLAQH